MPTGTATPPGPLTLEIAKILRGELARQKMNKTTLTKEVATVSRAQLSKMLNGEKPIDIEDLDRIAFALGLDVKDVLRDADAATQGRFLS